MPGQQPTQAYAVVWETNDEFDPSGSYNIYSTARTDDQVVESLREEAAKRGADAVLIDDIHRFTPAGPTTAERSSPVLRVSARAICFLDRHPELAEKK